MNADRRLRIGIALEACDVPAWQATAVRSIRRLDNADIVLFVIVERDTPSRFRVASQVVKLLDGNGTRLPFSSLATVSLRDIVGTTHSLALSPLAAGDMDQAIREIRARNLDALVTFANPELFGKCGALARLGLWFLDTGSGPVSPSNGSLAGLKEFLDRKPSMIAELRIRQSDTPGDLLAYTTCSAVHRRSHDVTRNELLWKCSAFVARALDRCCQLGPDEYISTLPRASRNSASPSNVSMFAALVSYFGWRAWNKFATRRIRERWVLLRCSHHKPVRAEHFELLVPPAGRFWADPHAIAVDDLEHVYFEDASCITGKGHISLMTRRVDGTFTVPTPLIQRPYHLSYPFIFAWKGGYFMIPESAENRTIELYRCTRFPDQWEFEHNLKTDIRAYDATLVEHNGRWWMFANVAECEGASSWDELCIFHADDPLSRHWQPHRSNPVISDVRRARPAGPFIRDNEILLRPSQDSSGRYGRALHLNRVEELNENTYRESTVRTINPDPVASLYAVHSFSPAGNGIYLDAIRRERK